MLTVTISGKQGSGKTTLAKKISQMLLLEGQAGNTWIFEQGEKIPVRVLHEMQENPNTILIRTECL